MHQHPLYKLSNGILLALSCLLILSLCSCSSFRKEDVRAWEQNAQLVPLDTSALNGKFSNVEHGTQTRWMLWDLVSKERSSYSTDIVEIQVAGPDVVRFSLIRSDKVIAVHELEYDAYATHIRFNVAATWGYAPLIWATSNFRSGTGLTTDNALSILSFRRGTLFLLFLPVYPVNKAPIHSIYQRVR